MSSLRDRLHWVRCKLHLHRWGFRRDYQDVLYRECRLRCRNLGPATCCTVRIGLAGLTGPRLLVAKTRAPQGCATGLGTRRLSYSGVGPCWVRTASGTTGVQRAGAVTTGTQEPQVIRHPPFRARTSQQPGAGFESHLLRPVPRAGQASPGSPGPLQLVQGDGQTADNAGDRCDPPGVGWGDPGRTAVPAGPGGVVGTQ
jgi:hypothetical protein